jgi:hypothetical protein
MHESPGDPVWSAPVDELRIGLSVDWPEPTEAGRVVLRLTRTRPASAAQVEALLREVFSVPSSDPRRLRGDLSATASELHSAWSGVQSEL